MEILAAADEEFARVEDALVVADHAPTPEERLGISQRLRLLEHALAQLPADHREVLLLREIEDLSYAEIAVALGVAEGTVKSRIAPARAPLIETYRRNTGGQRDD